METTQQTFLCRKFRTESAFSNKKSQFAVSGEKSQTKPEIFEQDPGGISHEGDSEYDLYVAYRVVAFKPDTCSS